MPIRKSYFPGYKGRYSAATRIQSVVRRRQARPKLAKLKLNPTVAKLVDRRINKKNESHCDGYWWRRYQFTNKIADDPANRINNVLPNIPIGAARGDRAGSSVMLTHCSIKGKIDIPADDNPLVGNDDRAQIFVRLMVLSCKKFKQIQEVRSNWNAGSTLDQDFFKTSDAGQSPLGEYIDMLRPINADAFTTHYDKVIKLDRNYGYFPDPTSTSGAAPQKPTSKEFYINIKCKNKRLVYEDATAVQPDNWQPFVCYLFCYGNGAVPSSSRVPWIEYLTKVNYKPN